MSVELSNRLQAAASFAAILLMAAVLGACNTADPNTADPSSVGEATSVSANAGDASAPDSGGAADESSSDSAGTDQGRLDDATPETESARDDDQGDGPSGAAGTATALVEMRLPLLEEILGSGAAGPSDVMLPVGIAVAPDGSYFLADVTGVRKLNADGSEAMRIGKEEIITTQGGLALGPDNRLYVTGFGPQVWVFDAGNGALLNMLGEEGDAPGQLRQPIAAAVDSDGAVYVADAANARVEKYDASGAHLLSIGERGLGRGLFTTPRAVAVDTEGYVYVGLGDDYLVQRFAPDGTYVDALGQAHGDENAWRVGGITIDDLGNVYVTQALSGRIQKFTAPEMHLEWELGSPGRDRDALSSPLGMAVDGDRLIVADQGNNRIKVYRLTR